MHMLHRHTLLIHFLMNTEQEGQNRVLSSARTRENETFNSEDRLQTICPGCMDLEDLSHHPGKLRPCLLVVHASNPSNYQYQHLLYRVLRSMYIHGKVLATISGPLGPRSQSWSSYGQCGSGALSRTDGTIIYLL